MKYSILDERVVIGKNCRIGKAPAEAEGITVIGAEIRVPDGRVIGDNEMISSLEDNKDKEEA